MGMSIFNNKYAQSHLEVSEILVINIHTRIQRGGGVAPVPAEKSQSYMVSLQYWSGFLVKSQATNKLAFNVGPSSARQRNAI